MPEDEREQAAIDRIRASVERDEPDIAPATRAQPRVVCGRGEILRLVRPASRSSGFRIRGPSGPAPVAGPDHRLWETAVLFHLRDAFRAGDVWLARSRRYGDIRKALLSAPAGSGQSARLARRAPVRSGRGALRRLAAAARAGAVAGGRKPPCRPGPLTWSPTSTGGCPRRGRANSWPTSRVRPTRRRRRRRAVSPCRTVSRRSTPLGWEHINLTGGNTAGRAPTPSGTAKRLP